MSQKHHLSGKAFLLGMNPVIRYLTISDVVILGASQLLAPVFAIFIIEDLEGGNVAVAGVAAALFMIAKSIAQVPVASIMDRIKGERDDYLFLFWGTFVSAALTLFYLVIDTPLELYLLQMVLGVATAVSFPSYMSIFTRHIDRSHENMEWGVRFTLTDLTGAFGAAMGGLLAMEYGFPFLILATTIFSVIGSFLLLPIRSAMKKR